MTVPALYLFDDGRARSWEPFALTRPVGELLFGCHLLRERTERALGLACEGHACGPELVGFREEGSPPVLDGPPPSDRPRVLLSSRWVAEPGAVASGTRAATLLVDGRVAGWVLPPGHPWPEPEQLLEPDTLTVGEPVEAPGAFLPWPWDLVARNGDRIGRDARGALLPRVEFPGVYHLGKMGVHAGPEVEVEPGVTLDARGGPILLAAGATVHGPARLVGPLWVGEGSTVLGGVVGESSVGPGCKVRGELEASVVTGFCNKAHDGFLGHALLGRWINLGASTTNSDLKNTYGSVRVVLSGTAVDTGLLKVGCLIGDHVKTGIGTLLTTGATVGAGSNVFGGGLAPRSVPAFAWGGADGFVPVRVEAFLETARTVMRRRGHELKPEMASLLRRAHARSQGEAR